MGIRVRFNNAAVTPQPGCAVPPISTLRVPQEGLPSLKTIRVRQKHFRDAECFPRAAQKGLGPVDPIAVKHPCFSIKDPPYRHLQRTGMAHE